MMDFNEVLPKVQKGIYHFTDWVSHASGGRIEKDDAEQELMIAVWKSVEKWNRTKQKIECQRWVMSDLYFAAKHLVHHAYLMESREKTPKTVSLDAARHYSISSGEDDILTRIVVEAALRNARPAVQEVVRMRLDGCTGEHIAHEMGYSRTWVDVLWKSGKKSIGSVV